MFIGQYSHNIDAKGRIIVPAKFRNELTDKVIITKGLDGCLVVYNQDQFEKLVNELMSLPETMKDARAYIRNMLPNACESDFDSQGRVLIQSHLLKAAQIQKECIFLGLGDHIELWSQESWQQYNSDNSDKFEEVAEKMTEYLR